LNDLKKMEKKHSKQSIRAITFLDPVEALSLVEAEIHLDLASLTSLSPETAQVLAQCTKNLTLDGLKAVKKEVADALCSDQSPIFKGELRMDGIESLDRETAEALSKWDGEALLLYGLTSLDTDTAKALSVFDGNQWGATLGLGIRTLSVETAQILASSQSIGPLYLSGIRELNIDQADALSNFKGVIVFEDLMSISDEALDTLHSGTCRFALGETAKLLQHRFASRKELVIL
jgi:hypothetical protein